MAARAFISGCAGTSLGEDERAFFRDAEPWGLILFRRNCEAPDQMRALAADFREAVGRPDAPVLIDQEGGRVQRLQPPVWPRYAACAVFGRIAKSDPETARRAAWLHGRLIAADLRECGVTVNCAPVLDVLAAGASQAIGDRAFGGDPGIVALLGRAVADGLLAGGVAPVVKHMPGQGRAREDSHYVLPAVAATVEELSAADFRPFAALADLPMAMTGHVVFSAVDGGGPATTSPAVIRDIIRERISFDGLLISDDVSMNALSGESGERAGAILAAGCDIVLHCNGRMAEMTGVAAAAPELDGRAFDRARRALDAVREPLPFDRGAGRGEYLALAGAAGWTA